MITPIPFEGKVAPPVQGAGVPGTYSAALFEQLYADLTASFAAALRSTATLPTNSKNETAPLPAVPEAEPGARTQAAEAMPVPAFPWASPARLTEKAKPEVADFARPALPAVSAEPVAAGPSPESIRRMDVLVDPVTYAAMRQRGSSFDLEIRPAPWPLHPTPSQRLPEMTEAKALPQLAQRVAARVERPSEPSQAAFYARTPERIAPETAVVSGLTSAPVEQVVAFVERAFTLPVNSPLRKAPSRAGGKDSVRMGEPVPGQSMSPTPVSGPRRLVFHPLGIVTRYDDSDPGKDSSQTPLRPGAPYLPVERTEPAAWTQEPRSIRTGEELFISKPQVPADTAVRFVLEDWNPDAPVRSIRISLEPRDLGPLRITLFQRGGQVHARMVVENTEALHAVQAQTQALQSALAERGMVFGSFSLTVASAATAAGVPAGPSLRPGLRVDSESEPHGEDDTELSKEEVQAR